jgi:hypothetical protein
MLTYAKGDLVQYNSSTHGEWLDAVVLDINEDSAVMIDLKPTSWLGKQSQESKLRPRKNKMLLCHRPEDLKLDTNQREATFKAAALRGRGFISYDDSA